MGDDTLRYMRSDTTRSPFSKQRSRDDPRLGARMVNLDGDIDPQKVRTVLIGVADDRGVGLFGGRLGAAEGPLRFRDYFWRAHAPVGVAAGSILDAGDLVGAARTNETHARLTEVVDVLRDRFSRAHFIVVGGGHDHVFGEFLGLARWLRGRPDANTDVTLAHVCITAHPNVHAPHQEPDAGGALRRMLVEPATRLDGCSLTVWGLQRAAVADKHIEFLRNQGAQLVFWRDIETDEQGAATRFADRIAALARSHDAVTLSLDLGAFAQSIAPGVSDPSPVGVAPAAVLQAIQALGNLKCHTQLGIYGLNPRFDRDGATARLAARIAWNYVTTRSDN